MSLNVEEKNKLLKRFCLPMKISIVISIIHIITTIPLFFLIENVYESYGLNDQLPENVIFALDIINSYRDNLLALLLTVCLAIGIYYLVYFIWKLIGKNIIESSNLLKEELEKKVKFVSNILLAVVPTVILIISIFYFVFVLLIPLMQVYMGAFLFEPNGM